MAHSAKRPAPSAFSVVSFLRVLRVLRGQTVCHDEEHEGHKVAITSRAKNARV